MGLGVGVSLSVTHRLGLRLRSGGLRGVRQLGEGARALGGGHVLSIFELRSDTGAHVGHFCFVGLRLMAVDGSPHQLGHLGLELLFLLPCHNFGLLQGKNALSDAIHSCRRFHSLTRTSFLTGCSIGSNLKLHFFLCFCLCLCLRKSQVVLQAQWIIFGVNHGGLHRA